MRQTQSNGTTTTVYPNGYYDVEGSDVRRHLLAGALGSVATSTWDGTDSDTVYHHKDHLGGTHVETDESGSVLEYIVYKPFGDSLVDSKSGTYENDKKFTGKEKDSTTGYYYYGARYYKADIGRFLSQDPVFVAMGTQSIKELNQILRDPQPHNSYTYSRNNPIVMVDKDGQWASLASLANKVDAIYNAITFGAGYKAAEMGKNGITARGVAEVAGGVAFGTVATSAAAATVGAGAGVVANVAPAAAAAIMPRATAGIAIGASFGKLGTVIRNHVGKITSFSYHGVDQAITRGVSTSTMLQTVRNPLVTLQQAGGNVMYLTQQAAVVLNSAGRVVTTYGSSEFNKQVSNIINTALNK